MEDIINFVLWLHSQRYKDSEYMNRNELEEMYLIYLEEKENESK